MEHLQYFGVPLTTLIGLLVGGTLVAMGKAKLLIPLMIWVILSSLLMLMAPELPVRLVSGIIIGLIFFAKNRVKISP